MTEFNGKGDRQGMMPHICQSSGNRGESFLKAAIDASGDILWVVNLDMKLAAFNRTTEAYFKGRYGSTLYIGAELDAFVPEAAIAVYRGYLEKALERGSYTVDTADAHECCWGWHFSKYEESGEPLAIAVRGKSQDTVQHCRRRCQWIEAEVEKQVKQQTQHLQEDKTALRETVASLQKVGEEQEQIEKLLIEAMRKAYSASAAKSGFLASMSHEIRTSINAVIGNLYLMQNRDTQQEPSALLHRAQKAAENLLEIINDILDFSKIEADEIVLELKPCSIRKILCDVEEILSLKAQEKHLHLEISAQSDITECLLVDEVKLRQILLNLAHNAIKFTETGHVRLRARNLPMDSERIMARFEIEDSGIGMTAEQISTLFLPFRQGPDTFEHQDTGTGLGLYICHRLVTLMEGSIQVYSEPSNGSCFVVSIPARVIDVREVHESLPAVPVPIVIGGCRVLVADDNEVNREVLCDILKSAGMRVDTAVNGMDALKKVADDQCYDLILLDIHMPVMDGYDVARSLRKNGSTIPIIAVTADVFQGVREESLVAGINGYLSKPVKPNELFKVIAEHVGCRRKQTQGTAETVRDADSMGSKNTSVFYGLEGLPGLNIQEAMERLEGQKNMYLKVLLIFLNTQIWTPVEIRHALFSQNPKAAAGLAHRLKGAAASIGAQQVVETSNRLQGILETGCPASEVSILVDQLETDLGVVKNAIITLLRHKLRS